LDDKANRAMEEVLRRGSALIDALKLTPVEREYPPPDLRYRKGGLVFRRGDRHYLSRRTYHRLARFHRLAISQISRLIALKSLVPRPGSRWGFCDQPDSTEASALIRSHEATSFDCLNTPSPMGAPHAHAESRFLLSNTRTEFPLDKPDPRQTQTPDAQEPA
jgi:hypothetical protein